MPSATVEGKVLITGASGFIGTRLREWLQTAGTEVVSVCRGEFASEEVGEALVHVDYAQLDQLEAVVRAHRPSYLIHLAGATKGRTYEDFRLGNVTPTESMLAALDAADHWPQRFVLVSSLASYGPSTLERPHQESDPRQPIEHYGASKLEAEQLVEQSGVPWTIIRPSAVYGPGDADYFKLFRSAMSGINAFFGNRDRVASMIYVDDCIRGIIQGACSSTSVGRGYFITTEESVSWGVLQDTIVDAVGGRARTVHLPETFVSVAAFAGEVMSRLDGKPRLLNQQKAKMGAQDAWTCTAVAARADFGFNPQVALREGIASTHRWYRDQGWYGERKAR